MPRASVYDPPNPLQPWDRRAYAIARLNASIELFDEQSRTVLENQGLLGYEATAELLEDALRQFWCRYRRIVRDAQERCRECQGKGEIQEWVDAPTFGDHKHRVPGHRYPCSACLGSGRLR